MHEKEIIQILKRARGEVDAPAHRSAFRRALLSSSSLAPLQRFTRIVSMNKYYLSLGSVATMAAIAMLVAISPLNPTVVSAQEQVNKAFTRAIALSPEERTHIEAKMKADMMKTLEEAKAAPDLKIMTKEEYEKEAQFTFSTHRGPVGGTINTFKFIEGEDPTIGGQSNFAYKIDAAHMPREVAAEGAVIFSAQAVGEGVEMGGSFSAGKMVLNHDVMLATATVKALPIKMLDPVKYLSYTDPEGRKTVLGLDENDTPVFKMSTLKAGDIKQLGEGVVGIEATQVQMINLDTQE